MSHPPPAEPRPATTFVTEGTDVTQHLASHATNGSASRKIANRQQIFLFDVDGTLTVPRKHASQQMKDYLTHLRQEHLIGIVGGSDLVKQIEQLGADLLDNFDYVFSENGLMGYKDGKLIHQQSFVNFIGEPAYQKFVKFILHYIADLDIPIKRGTFVEFRNGMINISPIGRNCSQSERDEFEQYDHKHQIRHTMIKALQAEFGQHEKLGKMKYSVGGQISFDVFPIGWDKTYCIEFLHKDNVTDIHFFGDKTSVGGNDYEIYTDKRVTGHSVKSPEDTMQQVTEVLQKQKS